MSKTKRDGKSVPFQHPKDGLRRYPKYIDCLRPRGPCCFPPRNTSERAIYFRAAKRNENKEAFRIEILNAE